MNISQTNLLDCLFSICYYAPAKRGNTLATQSQIAHPKGWNMTNVDNES